MYIPKHFEVTDKKEIFKFIEANAFGQLISSVEGNFFSTHMPFLVSENQSSLIGHLGKQNSQWQSLNGQKVLVTLQGPHDYISPSWYASPGVPTWNYQAVHIYGTCKTFHAHKDLKSAVDTLTKKYELSFNEPWEPVYKDAMLESIVGLEIEINDIQCKYKLSQNRSKQDQLQVIEQLKASGSLKLAAAMANNT